MFFASFCVLGFGGKAKEVEEQEKMAETEDLQEKIVGKTDGRH